MEQQTYEEMIEAAEKAATPMSITEPPAPMAELSRFHPVQVEIDALAKLNGSLVFQYDTKDGNKNARSHVFKIRQKKAEVERVRKEGKAEYLERGRKIDAVAKSLEAALDQMIAVHQGPLDEIDRQIQVKIAQQEKWEADRRAEAERVEQEKRDAALQAERDRAAAAERELAVVREQQREEMSWLEKLQRERQAEVDRQMAEERRKLDLERQTMEIERRAMREAQEMAELEKQQWAKAQQDRIEAELRKERERIQQEKEAVQRAESERLAAVQEKERQIRESEEAEQRRQQDAQVRVTIISEVSYSIQDFVADQHLAHTLAEAMVNGEIRRVSVNMADEPSVGQVINGD